VTWDDLAKDELYQLNLYLHLAGIGPGKGGADSIRPVFAEHGYAVKALSPRLHPVPSATSGSVGAKVNSHCRPDILLYAAAGAAIILELKTASFGAKSSTAAQLRVLLTVDPADLAQRLGRAHPPSPVRLVVAVNGARSMMEDGLAEVAKQCAGWQTCQSATVFGLDFDGECLRLLREAHEPVLSNKGPDTGVIIASVEPGDLPAVVYHIPYDPDIGVNSPLAEMQFTQRVTATLFAFLLAVQPDKTVSYRLTECSEQLCPSLLELLKHNACRKKYLERIRQEIENLCPDLQRLGFKTQYIGRTKTFSFETPPSHPEGLLRMMGALIPRRHAHGQLRLPETGPMTE